MLWIFFDEKENIIRTASFENNKLRDRNVILTNKINYLVGENDKLMDMNTEFTGENKKLRYENSILTAKNQFCVGESNKARDNLNWHENYSMICYSRQKLSPLFNHHLSV